MKKWKAFPVAALLLASVFTFTACGAYDNYTNADESNRTGKNTTNDGTVQENVRDNTVDGTVLDNNTVDGTVDNNGMDGTVAEDPAATADPDLTDNHTVVGELGDGVENVGDGVGQAIEDVGDGVGNAVENVGDAVNNAADNATDAR